jgi:MinD-like ATPase involved in chromosome partitioning or flagellar assembly
MPLIALGSVKGSPGVTTTALALAVAWPAPCRLLIEVDPSGGDLTPWLGLRRGPGLTALAAAARDPRSPADAWQYAQELPGGLHVIPGPPGAGQATACLAALDPAAGFAAFSGGPPVAVADCGRLDPGSPALRLASHADAVILIARPHVSDLAHLAHRLDALTRTCRRVGLLLRSPSRSAPAGAAYPAAEIEATLGQRVLGSLPSDPLGVAQLIQAGGSSRRARRLPLMIAASALAATLAAATQPGPSATADAAGAPHLHGAQAKEAAAT